MENIEHFELEPELELEVEIEVVILDPPGQMSLCQSLTVN